MSDVQNNFSGFILGKEYRKEVLQKLLRKPDYEYTINEIAKEVSGSYMSVRKFIKNLASFNVVEIKKKGNYSLIKLNKGSIYKDAILTLLRSDIEPLKEIAENYASKIKERFGGKIDSIYLFGSVAKGCADKESDIDILILTSQENEEKIRKKAPKIAQKLEYGSENPISPLVESKKEFEENLERRERFETEVRKFGIKLKED